jgi:hypothetical protein
MADLAHAWYTSLAMSKLNGQIGEEKAEGDNCSYLDQRQQEACEKRNQKETNYFIIYLLPTNNIS